MCKTMIVSLPLLHCSLPLELEKVDYESSRKAFELIAYSTQTEAANKDLCSTLECVKWWSWASSYFSCRSHSNGERPNMKSAWPSNLNLGLLTKVFVQLEILDLHDLSISLYKIVRDGDARVINISSN